MAKQTQLSNECPSCKSKAILIQGMQIVHADTEIYVKRYCPDCGCDFISIYQFDNHDMK